MSSLFYFSGVQYHEKGFLQLPGQWVNTHTHTHTYIHIYTHIYTVTHTHTHTATPGTQRATKASQHASLCSPYNTLSWKQKEHHWMCVYVCVCVCVCVCVRVCVCVCVWSVGQDQSFGSLQPAEPQCGWREDWLWSSSLKETDQTDQTCDCEQTWSFHLYQSGWGMWLANTAFCWMTSSHCVTAEVVQLPVSVMNEVWHTPV